MTYKKLDEADLSKLYKNLRGYFDGGHKHSKLTTLVEKYFSSPSSILISVDSEYNDSTYDNKAVGVFVYDDKDMEIPLNRSDREKFNLEVAVLSIEVPYESDEPMEDIVVYVNRKLPEVYIKEK